MRKVKFILSALLALCAFSAQAGGLDDIPTKTQVVNIDGYSADDSGNNLIFGTNGLNCTTETVYLSSEVNLESGTKIVALNYYGVRESNAAARDVVIYMENTADETPAEFNIATATKVYEQSYTFNKGGTVGFISDDLVDLVTFVLDEPFIYTGGNLRVAIQNSSDPSIGQTGCQTYNHQNTWTYYYTSSREYTNKTNNPMVRFICQKEASTFSGQLGIKPLDSDKTLGVAGAKITLRDANGDFIYSGTTDAGANFNIPIIKDDRTYYIFTDYSNRNYIIKNNYVTFSGSSIARNVIMYESDIFYYNSLNTPTDATVNNVYTCQATVTNCKPTAIEADSYTAKLIVDGEAVASADAIAVGSHIWRSYSFSFTPHSTGNKTAYFEFSDGESTVKSEEFTITVAAESANAEGQVLSEYRTFYNSPYVTDKKYNYTSTVYTADELQLANGCRIKSLGFKSYKTTANDNIRIRIWLENTEADVTDYSVVDPSSMTLIYDVTQTITAHGDENNPVMYINATLAEPFVYTGNNIRMIVQTSSENAEMMSFVCGNKQNTYQKTSSNADYADDNIRNASWGTWNYQIRYSPVLYLTYEAGNTISGTITDGAAAVADANVKLQSGDVYYEGTTDAEGQYNITVIQTGLEYNLTAQKDGYINHSESGISLGTSIADKDITLTAGENIIVTPAGMATYVSTMDLDYSGVAGLKAYKAKVDGNSVNLTKVTTVPAGEGVLLIADEEIAEDTEFGVPATTGVGTWADNDFIAGSGAALATKDGDYYNYILNVVGGVTNFYKANGQMVATNRAYLRTTAEPNATSRLNLIFDEPTGIENVERGKRTVDSWYDLQGRRVARTQKGIYIVNGKKVVKN